MSTLDAARLFGPRGQGLVWKLFGERSESSISPRGSEADINLNDADDDDVYSTMSFHSMESWDTLPTSKAPSSMISFARGAVGSTLGRFFARIGEKVLEPLENRSLKKEYQKVLKALSGLDSETWSTLKPLTMRSQFINRLMETTRPMYPTYIRTLAHRIILQLVLLGSFGLHKFTRPILMSHFHSESEFLRFLADHLLVTSKVLASAFWKQSKTITNSTESTPTILSSSIDNTMECSCPWWVQIGGMTHDCHCTDQFLIRHLNFLSNNYPPLDSRNLAFSVSGLYFWSGQRFSMSSLEKSAISPLALHCYLPFLTKTIRNNNEQCLHLMPFLVLHLFPTWPTYFYSSTLDHERLRQALLHVLEELWLCAVRFDRSNVISRDEEVLPNEHSASSRAPGSLYFVTELVPLWRGGDFIHRLIAEAAISASTLVSNKCATDTTLTFILGFLKIGGIAAFYEAVSHFPEWTSTLLALLPYLNDALPFSVDWDVAHVMDHTIFAFNAHPILELDEPTMYGSTSYYSSSSIWCNRSFRSNLCFRIFEHLVAHGPYQDSTTLCAALSQSLEKHSNQDRECFMHFMLICNLFHQRNEVWPAEVQRKFSLQA